MKIEKRYLRVPVKWDGEKAKLTFCENGKTVVALDYLSGEPADFVYEYDMREQLGKELTLSFDDEKHAFAPDFTDTLDTEDHFADKRPLLHFTARNGWNNDPNGLVYYEGHYHMFFQHNPVGNVWGNMHWGHAVSDDLIRWEEQEIALFPDDTGTMYSGSAIIDRNNVSGLKCNDHDPLLLFYTAAGTPFTQQLAYSTDGAKTFKKYGQIIPHIKGHNRDPKVVWCEETGCFLLALYLDGDEFAIFKSFDLLNWKILQTLKLENDNECPDMFPLCCNGKRYWIFTAAHSRYYIGEFEGGLFRPKYSGSLMNGGLHYAAQTFSDIPDKRIHIGWNRSRIPDVSFGSSMTTPCEMQLKELGGKPVLTMQPIAAFDNLFTEKPDDGRPQKLVIRPDTFPCEITILGNKIELTENSITCRNSTVRYTPSKNPFTVTTDRGSFELFAPEYDAYLCLDAVNNTTSADMAERTGAKV